MNVHNNDKLRKLLNEMRRLRLDSTESALDRCIYEEANALMDIPPRRRRTRARELIAISAAEDTYQELIADFLKMPEYVLSANDVLHRRCKANAWAIAQRVLEARRAP